MRIQLHKAEERGKSEHGWLSSRFSFSFAEWFNPERMGFGVLRVINDDVIKPQSGFGMHPHKDMEIITIVMEGAVTHKDSEGNEGTVSAGEVQVMSAGSGVVHSEYNNSPDEVLKLFQIWILPDKTNAPVRYDQKNFDFLKSEESSIPLVAPIGNTENGELYINQNAWITYANTKDGQFEYKIKDTQNGAYIFVIKGNCKVDEYELKERDALGITETNSVTLTGDAQFLIIDVPLG